MGIGMVLLVEADDVAQVELDLASRGERAVRIGSTVAGRGRVLWGSG
jgi:phosphoribosylaminoimidazole (AIR) synthetase